MISKKEAQEKLDHISEAHCEDMIAFRECRELLQALIYQMPPNEFKLSNLMIQIEHSFKDYSIEIKYEVVDDYSYIQWRYIDNNSDFKLLCSLKLDNEKYDTQDLKVVLISNDIPDRENFDWLHLMRIYKTKIINDRGNQE